VEAWYGRFLWRDLALKGRMWVVTGPRLPGSAVIVTAFPTLGSGSVPVGESLLLVGGSVPVSQPLST
jgi:hypothetical protein